MRRAVVLLGVSGVLFSTSSEAATILASSCFSSSSSCYSSSCVTGGADGSATASWPVCAIQQAINSASAGDTVLVDAGFWNASTTISLAGGITLRGQLADGSGNATVASLVFTGSGQLVTGSYNALTNDVNIVGLKIDGSSAADNWTPLVTMLNCVGCAFTANYVVTQPDGSYPSVLLMGGGSTTVSSNSFIPGPSGSGGSQLQLNPLGTPSTILPNNSGFEVYSNYFEGVGLTEIGLSDIRIHGNRIVDTSTWQYATGINFSPPYGGESHNISICDNYINAPYNFAVITGVPEDGGGQGSITGLVISGNVINSTRSMIGINSYDSSYCLGNCTTLTNTSDVVVSNNFLNSAWTSSEIRLDGGTMSGSVQNVTAQGNILTGTNPSETDPTTIFYDSNTHNMNIANNLCPGASCS
ncbi:MAG TPA: hypothetical protein VKZ18_13895 [Polyangia bacterium]|nr:hypothetical protein [Polyangia bacterium]